MFTNSYDGSIEDYLIELFKAKELQEKLNPNLPISVGLYVGKLSPKLEQQWKVFQYPKILFFADKDNMQAYTGGKFSQQILAWMKRIYRTLYSVESVSWKGFRKASDMIEEHKVMVIYVGKKANKSFKVYDKQAAKKNQLYYYSEDDAVAKKLILKSKKILHEIEFVDKTLYAKEDPEPYMDNEEYMRREAELEDNVNPHTGYWTTKQIVSRGKTDDDVLSKYEKLNEEEKKKFMDEERDKNQNLHVFMKFNDELWEKTTLNPEGEIFIMIYSSEETNPADVKGQSYDSQPINDDKSVIMRYTGDLTNPQDISKFIHQNSTVDVLTTHSEVETYWKDTENKTQNWMIYVYSDVKDINKNKSRFTKDEEVDEFEAEFILKDEDEQEKIRYGVNQFRKYAYNNKHKMKFATYNLAENRTNQGAVEEWGGSLNKVPYVTYLDGLEPINGKFRRYFKHDLFTYEDFDTFRSDVEQRKLDYFTFSETPRYDDDGKLEYIEDANYEGWIKLTGKSYIPFMRSHGRAKIDVVMWYMNNDDFRSKNFKKIMDEAFESDDFSEQNGYKYVRALIDSEKNEVNGYTYARVPYLAILKNEKGKLREYKTVFADNASSIKRFLTNHLTKIVQKDEM